MQFIDLDQSTMQHALVNCIFDSTSNNRYQQLDKSCFNSLIDNGFMNVVEPIDETFKMDLTHQLDKFEYILTISAPTSLIIK